MKQVLIVFLFLPFGLLAQTNESDTLNFKADLSLTGFFQGGNVNTVIFRTKAVVSFKPWKKGEFKTINSYVYQEFGKEKADEDILSLNFLNFNPNKKVYPLVLGFVSTNFRRKIDLRYLLGAGLTYQVLKKEDNWIKFSLTSEYEQTDFNESNFNESEFDGNQTIKTMRGTFWLNGKHHLFEKKIIIGYVAYIQPSLENSNNYRWQADLNLETPIWKWLNFKINYLHNFESVVIEGQEQADRFLTFGFTVKNY